MIGICFPSRAPRACGMFYFHRKMDSTCNQSSGSVEHRITWWWSNWSSWRHTAGLCSCLQWPDVWRWLLTWVLDSGALIQVLSLWNSGVSLCSNSWKSLGGIRMKFWYAIGSSSSSLGISPLYWPSSSRTAWVSYGLTPYPLYLRCLTCRPHLLLSLSIIAEMMTASPFLRVRVEFVQISALFVHIGIKILSG